MFTCPLQAVKQAVAQGRFQQECAKQLGSVMKLKFTKQPHPPIPERTLGHCRCARMRRCATLRLVTTAGIITLSQGLPTFGSFLTCSARSE